MHKLNNFKFDLQLFADGGGGIPKPAEPKEPNEPPKEPAEPKEPKEPEKTFTQTELDEIIAKRIERERKKYADYDDLKSKITEYEKQIEEKRLAEMSEKERAKEIAKKRKKKSKI